MNSKRDDTCYLNDNEGSVLCMHKLLFLFLLRIVDVDVVRYDAVSHQARLLSYCEMRIVELRVNSLNSHNRSSAVLILLLF